jgi:hypothetical protein
MIGKTVGGTFQAEAALLANQPYNVPAWLTTINVTVAGLGAGWLTEGFILPSKHPFYSMLAKGVSLDQMMAKLGDLQDVLSDGKKK